MSRPLELKSSNGLTPVGEPLLGSFDTIQSPLLPRLDDGEQLRRMRAQLSALRHYVPGAVAARLESCRPLESEEREVSIMFVDIQGYTSFSEERNTIEVFAMVNRYTRMVSQVVCDYGGNVVEFNGDGMMAIFGAPDPLPHKERAAIEAGRTTVTRMASVTGGAKNTSSFPLRLRVGIATGPAFVGDIEAVDRAIWSAIGDTANLAARLQTLTRDLGAVIVIDRASWEASGAAAADFQLAEGVAIRGRRQAEDVYLLLASSYPPVQDSVAHNDSCA